MNLISLLTNTVKVEVLVADKFSHNVYISKRFIEIFKKEQAKNGLYSLTSDTTIGEYIKMQSSKTKNMERYY